MSQEKGGKERAMPKHGEICWTEIATTNLDQIDAFYDSLFGWKIKSDNNAEFEYRHFEDGRGEDVGGMYEMNPEMFGGHAVPPHFMTYIAVDDVDEAVEKAKSMGAEVQREPMDIPGTGRMAVIKDPLGAVFAVITLSGGK